MCMHNAKCACDVHQWSNHWPSDRWTLSSLSGKSTQLGYRAKRLGSCLKPFLTLGYISLTLPGTSDWCSDSVLTPFIKSTILGKHVHVFTIQSLWLIQRAYCCWQLLRNYYGIHKIETLKSSELQCCKYSEIEPKLWSLQGCVHKNLHLGKFSKTHKGKDLCCQDPGISFFF